MTSNRCHINARLRTSEALTLLQVPDPDHLDRLYGTRLLSGVEEAT